MKKSVLRPHFKNTETGLKCKRSNSRADFENNGGILLKSTRSQITIFIIIAVLLVVSIAAVFYFSSLSNENVTEDLSTLSSSEITSQIKTQRDTCLDEKTIFAIDAYGLDEVNVQNFLSQNLAACIQPTIKKYQDVAEITLSSLSVSVKINDEKIEIIGNYPVSVTKGDTQNLDSFSLTLSRTITTSVQTNVWCQANSDIYLKSWDDKFEIFVPYLTKMQNPDGSCIDEIGLRIEDPIKTYGNRTASLTSLVYIPLPLGAEFSVNKVQLKQEYTSKDYMDYYKALQDSGSYLISEDKLKLWYYDSLTKNYYIYPGGEGLTNSVNVTDKEINANVNIFYDGLIHHSSPEISKATIIESFDRRMNIILPRGTIITKDGNNVNKIAIVKSPKRSHVVNFGMGDYNFYPGGAIIEPSTFITYKYSQEEADNPEFRYGAYNWENLINETWQNPQTDKPPVFSSLKTGKNEGDIIFSFVVTDDIASALFCNLYVENTLVSSISVQNTATGTFTKKLDNGKYSWQIGCFDAISEEKSAVQEVVVGSSGILNAFLPLSNFARQTGYAITGYAASDSRSGLEAREEKDLKLAWYDNGVYRPLKTTVDTVNKRIKAEVTFFSGGSIDTNAEIENYRAQITGFSWFSDYVGDVANIFGAGSYFSEDEGSTELIAAKGCTDAKYGAFNNVNTIPKVGENCTGIADQPGKEVKYTIVAGEGCGAKESMIEIIPKTSTVDTGVLDWPDKGKAEAGEHTFKITLTDADKKLSDREDNCAWADAYLSVTGIGVNTDWQDKKSNMLEADWNNATGLAGWNLASCASMAEKKEACEVCVGFAKEDIAAGGGRVGKAGDTMGSLDFCTETLYGEGAEWDPAKCLEEPAGCRQDICYKCIEFSQAEDAAEHAGTLSSLSNCIDVLEHECGSEETTTENYGMGNCKELGGTYNRSTEQYLGYGLVRYWPDLNEAEVITFADALAVNGLTATYIEYFGMDEHQQKYQINDHPEKFYPQAKFLVNTMRERNITTFINYINWNLPDMCNEGKFSDAWFTTGLGGLIQQIGTDKVILQTALEGGERCTDKFTRWNGWMAQNWGGMKSYSIDGGVKSAPSPEWFINPTPGPSGAFATGAIVTTDDGSTLRYFADRDGAGNANPTKLENYAGGINIGCKSGFIYYDFGYYGKKPDTGAIQALGKIAAKKPKPTPQTAPNITLTSPKEGEAYKTLSIPIDGTSNQADIVKAGYKINGGDLTLFTLPHNITAKEGENRLELYAQNSAGLIGNVNVTFRVNLSVENLPIPTITIINPINDGNYEANIPLNKTLLNITSNQKISSWKYSLNEGEKNNSFTNPSQITVNEGENNLIVYGTNANGTGSASVSFNVRMVNPAYSPKITIEYPAMGFTYTSNLIFIKTASNQTINSWAYSLNAGEKVGCNFCDLGDSLEAPEGRNNLTIYGTNANGTGSASTYFFVSTTSD